MHIIRPSFSLLQNPFKYGQCQHRNATIITTTHRHIHPARVSLVSFENQSRIAAAAFVIESSPCGGVVRARGFGGR